MTDRRRRGARRSSNCFQTSSAFGFLVFIVRSRKEVDSRQLTVHRQEKNIYDTHAGVKFFYSKEFLGFCAHCSGGGEKPSWRAKLNTVVWHRSGSRFVLFGVSISAAGEPGRDHSSMRARGS